jgi:hypothetical protein
VSVKGCGQCDMIEAYGRAPRSTLSALGLQDRDMPVHVCSKGNRMGERGERG